MLSMIKHLFRPPIPRPMTAASPAPVNEFGTFGYLRHHLFDLRFCNIEANHVVLKYQTSLAVRFKKLFIDHPMSQRTANVPERHYFVSPIGRTGHHFIVDALFDQFVFSDVVLVDAINELESSFSKLLDHAGMAISG